MDSTGPGSDGIVGPFPVGPMSKHGLGKFTVTWLEKRFCVMSWCFPLFTPSIAAKDCQAVMILMFSL